MKKKYWFPAVLCQKSIDENGSGIKAPTIACPKCEWWGGIRIDEKGSFTLCKYQTLEETVNE